MNLLLLCSSVSEPTFNWVNLVSIIIAGLSALLGSYAAIKSNRIIAKVEKNKGLINKLELSLREFYIPFTILCKKNEMLYKIFKNKPKTEDLEKKDLNERTLIRLLKDKDCFKGNDKILLDEIIKVDRALNNLILSKGNYVDDPILSKYLSEASLHFTLIINAYNGTICGEESRYSEYVYPDILNSAIDSKIQIIIKDIEQNQR